MNGENQQIAIDEPVEFEKQSVKVEDFKKTTDHFSGIWEIYPSLIRKTKRSQHVNNRWDLKLVRFGPIMPKHLPRH
jgi:hypothetical protein